MRIKNKAREIGKSHFKEMNHVQVNCSLKVNCKKKYWAGLADFTKFEKKNNLKNEFIF